MTEAEMAEFATNWINDWNSHDIERILSHYAQTIEFHSPKVSIFTEGAKTYFSTREELRPYFLRALANRPNLHFKLIQTCADANGIALVYQNDIDAIGVELMDIDEKRQIIRARVLYGKPKIKDDILKNL